MILQFVVYASLSNVFGDVPKAFMLPSAPKYVRQYLGEMATCATEV
jgi:hypothetical protein